MLFWALINNLLNRNPMSNRPKSFAHTTSATKAKKESGISNKKLKRFGLYFLVGFVIFWFLIWAEMAL